MNDSSGPASGDAVPILVFARAPHPRACKTRLAERYGSLGATRIYRRLVTATVRAAQAAGCGPVEIWTTPAPHPFLASFQPRASLHRQPHGDLGQRMARALAHALRRGAPAALLVGSDCAALSAEALREAARQLRAGEADVVLQPASDGGFVLIGARRELGQGLRGIAWSSGRECAQTQVRLERRGLRVARLSESWDVDRPADVRRARAMGLL